MWCTHRKRKTSTETRVFETEHDARDSNTDETSAKHSPWEFEKQEATSGDVTLRVGERVIRAHKTVICRSSSYFRAMFSGNFSESYQQNISIRELDADFLQQLIDYMYTGKLNINFDNVKELLLTALFLQITSAEELCCAFILDRLNRDNCIEYLSFAGNTSINRLFQSSFKKTVSNFPYIFGKNGYLELGFEEMKKLTQSVKSNGYPEDMIFSFAMRWIKHSCDTRLQSMEDLLQIMNPLLVSPSVIRSSEFMSYPPFSAWADRIAFRSDTDDWILVSRTYGKIFPTKMNMTSKDERHQINVPPDGPTHGSYVCNEYYIYHQGGLKNQQVITESYAYHQTERAWAPFVPRQEARAWHRSVVLNGKIFSVGGSDGARALATVEFTDLYSGQSAFTDPLPHAKERPGLGVHENALYVVGGSDRDTNYACAHRLDEREGLWQEVAPLLYKGSSSSCAVLDDNIYTTPGGILQRYDIRANHWHLVPNQDDRYLQDVFTVNKILFGAFYECLARYLPDEGKWEDHRTFKRMHLALDFATNLLIPNVPVKEYLYESEIVSDS